MLLRFFRPLFLVAGVLFLGGFAPAWSQDDDDSAFVPPAWAAPIVNRAANGDFDGALRELNRLAPAHRGSYVVPLLRAKIWGEKYVAAGDSQSEIAALQNERRALLEARPLATGAQNAKIRAEIEHDLREAEKILRDEGVSLTERASTPLPVKKAPTAVPRPAQARPIQARPTQAQAQPISAAPATKTAPIVVKKLARLKPRRGYVIGRAIFPDGRPVPNFKVQVLGYDGQVNIFPGSTPSLGRGVGKNGFYAVRTVDTFRQQKPVAGLVVAVQASTKIRYAGKDYPINLKPIDGLRDGGGKGEFKGNSGPGVVRDFVVAISGVKPQFRIYNQDENEGPNESSTFYGAQLTLNLSFAEGNNRPLSDTAPQESILEVTLVPQGALLDGSRGQTQIRRVKIKPAPYYFYLRNIPIGTYNVSAKLRTPTGEVWDLRGSTTRDTYTSTTNVLFPPSFSEFVGGADTVSLFLVR